jgi:RimJ/RimL family protein N-acetyltransferase
VIQGARVTLRPPREEEIPALAEMWSDPEVMRYEPGRLAAKTRDWWEAWLRRQATNDAAILWAIDVGGEAAGVCGLRDLEPEDRHATSLISLFPRFWRKGYATEAVALRSRYAFETLGLEKIKTDTSVENQAIRRVLERAGYRTVGIARRERLRDGQWQDAWYGELLREDWEALTRPAPHSGGGPARR